MNGGVAQGPSSRWRAPSSLLHLLFPSGVFTAAILLILSSHQLTSGVLGCISVYPLPFSPTCCFNRDCYLNPSAAISVLPIHEGCLWIKSRSSLSKGGGAFFGPFGARVARASSAAAFRVGLTLKRLNRVSATHQISPSLKEDENREKCFRVIPLKKIIDSYKVFFLNPDFFFLTESFCLVQTEETTKIPPSPRVNVDLSDSWNIRQHPEYIK